MSRVIKRLSTLMSEPLNWERGNFYFPNMIRLHTIADGSCFFHAVVKAYHVPYEIELKDGKRFDRKEFITKFRQDLANKLSEPISPDDSRTNYDVLSRGQLKRMADESGIDEYRIDNMKAELASDEWVWSLYIEYVSNMIGTWGEDDEYDGGKDIYILDMNRQDVYVQGDEDIYHKGRDSIVILYLEDIGHFETIGLNDNGRIRSFFDTNSLFITKIRERLRERKMRKNDLV